MDIERAKYLELSPDWRALCGEIDKLIKCEETKLKSCTVEELKSVQLKIQAFEQVKILPRMVMEREE